MEVVFKMNSKKQAQPRLLELFAGSRSVGKEAQKLNMEVVSVDIEPFDGITAVGDIMAMSSADFCGPWSVVWASPPCTRFSILGMNHYWRKTGGFFFPRNKKAKESIALVKHTLRIIRELHPAHWYVENPVGILRKMKFMQHLPIRRTVTYCQYGDTRMKPTDIWTNNLVWAPRPRCKNGDTCHAANPRHQNGESSTGSTMKLADAYARSQIPAQLCREILLSSLSEIEGRALAVAADNNL